MSTEQEKKELITRPEFLPAYDPKTATPEDLGIDLIAQYRKPPRLKIVQSQSKEPFKPPFANYDIIVVPQMVKVGDNETPFSFTPIYFFPTYAVWNPWKLRDKLPTIRDQTFDPNHIIAQKARKFIKEPCPEDKSQEIRYCTHLNFYYMIHGIEELEGLPIVQCFYRGEYKTGESLMSLVDSRVQEAKKQGFSAPIFSHRYQAMSEDHDGPEGIWFGLSIWNDGEQMWVTPEQYEAYEKIREELRKLHLEQAIEITHDDNDLPQGNTVDVETSEF